MMKALVTANLSDWALEYLRETLEMRVDYRPVAERDGRFSSAELAALLADADVFVVGYEGVSADLLDRTDLDVVACPRGGPEANVDVDAATERGIPVLYTPGRNATSVADFTMGLVLGVTRHIPHAHRLLHRGVYTGEPAGDASAGGEREDVVWGVTRGSPYTELKGIELADRTLGIVGFGAVGRKVAERARGFEMDVLAHDPYVDKTTMRSHGVERVPLRTLCRESDVVSVHAAVTEETRGLIGAEEFELMGEDTYFVNTARAAIADQEALVEQLERDGLGGAALDVYEMEPLPDDHPLFEFDNVVTTPHVAAATTDVIERHSRMVVTDLERLLNGLRPEHVANESVLDQYFDRQF